MRLVVSVALGIIAWASEGISFAQAQAPGPGPLIDSFDDSLDVPPPSDPSLPIVESSENESLQEHTDVDPLADNAGWQAPTPVSSESESVPFDDPATASSAAPSGAEPWDVDPGPWAGTPPSDVVESKTTKARRDFDATLRLLLTGGALQPTVTPLNPANAVLVLPRASADLELRPDLTGTAGEWTLNARPRAALRWRHPTLASDDEVDIDAYLLEWSVRWQVAPPLYLIGGKQNLSWGPSLFASPSNEILLHNKHLNPVVETAGTYLARVVWIISPAWSASAIANVLRGERQELYKPFERRYAVKLDYSGESLQVTTLAALGEHSLFEAGGYVLWVATDELFLYADWRFAMRSGVRRPSRKRGAELGIFLDDSGGRWDPAASVLAGASYTFANNITAIVEYLLQTDGYTASEADLLWTLQHMATTAFLDSGSTGAASGADLASAYDYQLRYLRRHYFIPQVRYQWKNNQGTLSMLWVLNMDDWTSSLILSLEFAVSSHVTIGGFAMLNTGNGRGELSRLVDGVGTALVSYTF